MRTGQSTVLCNNLSALQHLQTYYLRAAAYVNHAHLELLRQRFKLQHISHFVAGLNKGEGARGGWEVVSKVAPVCMQERQTLKRHQVRRAAKESMERRCAGCRRCQQDTSPVIFRHGVDLTIQGKWQVGLESPKAQIRTRHLATFTF